MLDERQPALAVENAAQVESVTLRGGVTLFRFVQPALCVGSCRIKKPVAHRRVARVDRYQGLLDEAPQDVDGLVALQLLATRDRGDGVERERPDEDRQPA